MLKLKLLLISLFLLLISGCSSNGDYNINGTVDISLHDGEGNPLSSYYNTNTDRYVLNIHDADVHNFIINANMHQHTNITTTLINATIGDGSEIYIYVANTSGFIVGDNLHIENGRQELTHPFITAINGNRFTLDRKIDLAHPIGTNITKSILNLASQSGNITHPVEYWIGPPEGEVWHITRLIFSMELTSAGDLGLFGNLNALNNGILLRAKINNSYGTFTNWKTNSDIKTDMYDVEFDTRSGGGGTYGMSGRGTFKKLGTVISLDGNTNDRIELYVQDDITGIPYWTMKIQGHVEGR